MSDLVTKPFKGLWIPKEILENNDLKPAEKMLLAEIHSFCSKKHTCKATNSHFAKHINLSERRIISTIMRLKKSKYIIVEYNEDKNKREMADFINWNEKQKQEGRKDHCITPTKIIRKKEESKK